MKYFLCSLAHYRNLDPGHVFLADFLILQIEIFARDVILPNQTCQTKKAMTAEATIAGGLTATAVVLTATALVLTATTVVLTAAVAVMTATAAV